MDGSMRFVGGYDGFGIAVLAGDNLVEGGTHD